MAGEYMHAAELMRRRTSESPESNLPRPPRVTLLRMVAGRAVVKGGDAHHLADRPQLRDSGPEGDGRLADVAPQADERAHLPAL